MKDFKKSISSVVYGRNFSPSVITALIIAIFVVANTLIYVGYSIFMANSPSVVEIDLSISDTAKPVFDEAKNAGKKITVTFCMSEQDFLTDEPYIYRTVKNFAEKYPGFIEMRYANIFTLKYEDTGEYFDAEQYKKIPRKDKDGAPVLDADKNQRYDEYALGRQSIIFECSTADASGNVVRKNTRVVKQSDFYILDSDQLVTAYIGEEIFTAIANWVIENEHKTAYFTMGHGEVPSLNFYNALICAGYYIEEINLRKSNVPEDAALVIISNPKSDFERAAEGSGLISELDRLDDYKKRGGSFYVVVDPLARKLANLEAFCADFGIGFKENEDGERLMIKDLDRAIGTDGFTLVNEYSSSAVAKDIYNKISGYGGNVIIRDVAALSCDESKGAKPLLTSSASATLEAGGETQDDEGSYTTVAYSERYNESADPAKMVFIPSVYLTADDAMITNGYSNKDFIYSLFDVFYGAENMPYDTNVVPFTETTMLENLTLGASIIYTVILLAIPVVVTLIGTVIIIRRKNR